MLRSTVSIRFEVRVLTGNSGIPHLQSHVDGLTRPLSAFFLVPLAVLWGLECCSNPFGRSYTTPLALSHPSLVMMVVMGSVVHGEREGQE